MKCFYCDTELVWLSEAENEDGGITSFYICPKCNAEYEVNKEL